MPSTDALLESADHTFNFGYVASNYPVVLRDLPQWQSETFGGFVVHRHPLTKWAAVRHPAASVAVIGDPVDIEAGSTDVWAIADNMAGILASEGLQAALHHAAYLGGRATILLDDGDGVVIIPDFAATQSIYWHHDHSGTAFSNYAHLLAEITGSAVNEPYRDLMRNAKNLGATGTIYWPGIETPFEGIQPVLPNHALHVGAEDTPQHRRFYPFPDTAVQREPESAYDAFRSLFLQHTRLLCTTSSAVGISLTAGSDSQTTLAAAAPHLHRDSSLTWTYLDTSKPHPGMAADAEAAVGIAQRYGLRHQIVDLRQEGLRALGKPTTEFGRAYDRSMRYTPQFRRLAAAYEEQLPSGIVQLQSMVAEVGTGFYKRRHGHPDVERLSRLYSGSPFGQHPLVQSAFERYIAYADLSDVQGGPLDWHDLFYLESRLGRWATLRIQEVDLSHRALLPFNARGIVEALAGPPLEERVDKQALKRLIVEHQPKA